MLFVQPSPRTPRGNHLDVLRRSARAWRVRDAALVHPEALFPIPVHAMHHVGPRATTGLLTFALPAPRPQRSLGPVWRLPAQPRP